MVVKIPPKLTSSHTFSSRINPHYTSIAATAVSTAEPTKFVTE